MQQTNGNQREHRSGKARVALLGANGQIAAEIALFSTLAEDLEVIGFVRSEYSAIMLKLLGIEYHVIDYDCINQTSKELLASCDLVVDFSYPGLHIQEILPAIKHTTAAVIRCMRRGAPYAYMSSIAAFGMPPESSEIHQYIIPRNTYAFIKRRAEKFVIALAREAGIIPYIFRLGQVHGVLQSVSKYFMERMSVGSITTSGQPDSLCNIIFTHSVYHTLVRCARHELVPNVRYTLVALPQWTLQTLFHYYQEQLQSPCDVIYTGFAQRKRGSPNRSWSVAALFPSRGVIEPALITIFPSLLPRLKAWYRRKAVRSSVNLSDTADILNITGSIASPNVGENCSLFTDTVLAQRQIQERLVGLLEANTI